MDRGTGMDDELVTYEMDGPVALIGLNRPAKRNALNLALMADLEAAAARAASKARAAVIFGHGDHFSAGLDLAELFQRIKDGAPRDPAPAFASIAAGAIPFVAALHGAVIGGGLEIAANSPAANQAITQGLARIADLPQDQGLFLEGLVGDAVLARGSDEGLRAFLDKTARPIARPGK